jgi:protease IV
MKSTACKTLLHQLLSSSKTSPSIVANNAFQEKSIMYKALLHSLALCALLLAGLVQTTVLAQDKAGDKTAAKAAKAGVIAHIRLQGALDESPVTEDPLFGTSGENFKSKIDRINQAAKDENVQALLIHVDGTEIGWAKVAELRRAIEEFRKTGKKAYAYFDSAESKDYLVASSCDFIAVPESGGIVLVGVRAEVTFYKELLEKLGIKAEFISMGVFKSFAEPFTRSKMSP